VSVPDFQTLMRPTLVALEDRQAHTLQEIRQTVALALQVSEMDQEQLLPSGKQTTYSNRVAWALTHMGKAGLVSRPARARYTLTQRGYDVLARHPEDAGRADAGAAQPRPGLTCGDEAIYNRHGHSIGGVARIT